MFKVSKSSANRVDIQLSGSLDSAAMREGLNALEAKSENISNGRMLYSISNIALPTFGAVGVDIGHLPKIFGLIGKFNKCAVVADASWVRAVAAVEGALIPGLSIKAYAPDEITEAEAWLAAET